MIIEWIAAILLIIGSLFMLVSAIGIVRLPDIYMRIHAITKATSFGTLLMIAAVLIIFPNIIVIVESIMIITFIFMTAPVAAHMIGRIAHALDAPLWKKSVLDELRDSTEIDFDSNPDAKGEE